VTWFWKPQPAYRSQFKAEHVNILASMVRRNYPSNHRFICVTDSPEGIDSSIEIVPLWNDFATIPSPHGRLFPSCYRRLKAFSAEAREWFGDRFVSLDLDCVVTGNLAPLWDRKDDFIIWGDTHRTSPYNGSMFMMTAGCRKQVWDDFNPSTSPAITKAMGYLGSDQAWIGARLGTLEHKWTSKDGVCSYRNQIATKGGALPVGARIVFYHGNVDPWSPQAQSLKWVRDNYHL